MPSFFEKLKNDENGELKRKVYRYLVGVIVVLGLFIAFGILFPSAAAVILNIIWVTLFAVVITFLTLGILVVVGLREEVSNILDILLEGSLTVIDAIDLLKKAWTKLKELIREFVVFAAPVLAYIVAFIIYITGLVIYKKIGGTYDITGFTVLVTIFMIAGVGYLNRPTRVPTKLKWEWLNTSLAKFHRSFTDGLEVVLFIFFLTMDSTNLFFLPKNLNHPLDAKIGFYDLMKRGFDLTDNTQVTITLIIITIVVEIVRNVLRVIAMARKYSREIAENTSPEKMMSTRSIRIKDSIRKSFADAKDELTKFIAFNTVLLIVFLLFPRLKLLTLAVASLTGFALDFILSGRMTIKEGEDLISRVLSKTMGL
jgi:hypothetical protein